MKKLNVLLRGPALTFSGYSTHVRQIYSWLESNEDKFNVFVNTTNWGNCSWILNRNYFQGKAGRIMDKTGNFPSSFDISFQVQLPNEWDSKLATKNVGITAGVETDICNPVWLHKINEMNLVIVPSEHAKKTFEISAQKFEVELKTKIIVVPESFMEEVNNPKLLDLNFETSFNFLIFGQLTGKSEETDRKNIYKTLRWISETFRKDSDVGIVLKTNIGRSNQFDKQATKDIVKAALASVRQNHEKNVPVYLLHGEMTNEEVAGLYRNDKIKAFVNLGKGEGFCLPMIDAAASDLPVVATNWSGYLDFMNKGKFLNVDFDLRPIHQSKIDKNPCFGCNGQGSNNFKMCSACLGTKTSQIFMEGARWAEPRELSAKKTLKKFREMPDMPKEWAKNLGEVIRKDFSQKAIQNNYNEVLSMLGI